MKKPNNSAKRNYKSRFPQDAVLPHISSPIRDDPNDDLPPHIDFDYSTAWRNPYAGRVQFTHGGTRKGAGRKRAPEPVESHTVTLYKSHVKFLRKLDPSLSRAIRKMIEARQAK